MFYRALCIAFVFILGGCATGVDRNAVKAQISGKSLSVIVTAGTELEMSWIGTTVFNNERKTLSRPDWNLKVKIESTATEQLNRGGFFGAVRVEQATSKNKSEIISALKSDSDLLLVLSPSSSGDYVWGTSQPLFGLGVRQRSAFGLPPVAIAYVTLHAELFDRKSGQKIAAFSNMRHQFTPAPLEQDANLKSNSETTLKEIFPFLIDVSVKDLLTNLGLV
jgi:hypothetical protein